MSAGPGARHPSHVIEGGIESSLAVQQLVEMAISLPVHQDVGAAQVASTGSSQIRWEE